jgi:hypothetical protein
MSLVDMSIEQRGYTPASIALAVRTIGACPAACHRPDARILCGIGSVSITPDQSGGYLFSSDARCLGEEHTADDLLDWLEVLMPATGAVVSWHNWGSVPRRLLALADPIRHPRIIIAATETAGRWRDMPLGHTWHMRQARAKHMPCLCGPETPVDECDAVLPAVLLPDPVRTAAELIGEAIAGWQTWARQFGDFDDTIHPAQAALRALDRWRADQRVAR